MTPEEFKAARNSIGLSQKALAEQLGVGKRTIERIETSEGCTRVMQLAMERLADRWQGIETSRPIMLEIAAASNEHEMWERRYFALCQMYPIERVFADRDGKWGLRDFLTYVHKAMGFRVNPKWEQET